MSLRAHSCHRRRWAASLHCCSRSHLSASRLAAGEAAAAAGLLGRREAAMRRLLAALLASQLELLLSGALCAWRHAARAAGLAQQRLGMGLSSDSGQPPIDWRQTARNTDSETEPEV
mmetsp:Transcript_28848/g.89938  ORF Transcript_28848/g.89938 Transcript_28848/m.89938 type:complete len:117 (-) Transcript_28848:248-598(-)